MDEASLRSLDLLVVILLCAVVFCAMVHCGSPKTPRHHKAKKANSSKTRAPTSSSVAMTTIRLTTDLDDEDAPVPDVSYERVLAQYKALKVVFKRHEKELAAWWADKGKEERRNFLLSWCPRMPLARDKPYTDAGGERLDLRVNIMQCPEINQADLVEGDRLLELLRQVTSEDEFAYFCLGNVYAAFDLVGVTPTKLSPQEFLNSMVCTLPGEKFGKKYAIHAPNHPKVKEALEEGLYVRTPVWEALMHRLHQLLSTLAMCVDAFRVDVLKRRAYSAVGPQFGCAHCGALEPQGAGSSDDTKQDKLEACTGCRVVFYCSKASQEADWQVHKPYCKPKELRDKEAAERAAERAARKTGNGNAARSAAASSDKQD